MIVAGRSEDTEQGSAFSPIQTRGVQCSSPEDCTQSCRPSQTSQDDKPEGRQKKRKRSCSGTNRLPSTLASSASSETLVQTDKPITKGIELVCTCHACHKTIKGLGNMKVHLSICGQFGERKKWTCIKCPNKAYHQEQFYKKHHHDKHREACPAKSSTYCSHADDACEDVDPPKVARGCGVCGEYVPSREYLLAHVTQHYKETQGNITWTPSNEFLGLLRQPVVAGGETIMDAMHPCRECNNIGEKELELVSWDGEHMTTLRKKLQSGFNQLTSSSINALVLEILRAGGFNVEATPDPLPEERPEVAQSSVSYFATSSVARQLESSVYHMEEQSRHRGLSTLNAQSLHETTNQYEPHHLEDADLGSSNQFTYISDELWSFDSFEQSSPELATSFDLSACQPSQRSMDLDMPSDHCFDMSSSITVSRPGLTPLPSFDWPLG